MTQTKTPTAEAGMTTLREAVKRSLNIWHQSSCYPMASDGELDIGADAVLAALAASTAPSAPAAVPDELREALKPFATFNDAATFLGSTWSKEPDSADARHITGISAPLTIGMFRTASAALAAAPAAPPADGGTEQEQALRYAEGLTRALHEKHWKVDAPEWQPLAGDLIGMLTQIDNMTAGLSRTPAGAAGDPVGEPCGYRFVSDRGGDHTVKCVACGQIYEFAGEDQPPCPKAFATRPASPAPTPSPESTLSPAQVAPRDGGGLNLSDIKGVLVYLTRGLSSVTADHVRSEIIPAIDAALATTPVSAGKGDLREAGTERELHSLIDDVVTWADEHGAAAQMEYVAAQERAATELNAASERLKAYVSALARHQAPAVDVPAERERIAEIIADAQIEHEIDLAYDGVQQPHYDLADAILATRPTDPGGARGEIVRHVKHGTEYEVLGEAEAQVSEGMKRYDGGGAVRLIKDGDQITVYRGSDGKLWCRFTDEFRDGRFVPAASVGGQP